MKIFYFTSTGNSLALAKQFDCELYSIPQLLKNNGHLSFEDDAIGFIFPTHAFSVPKLVLDFLNQVTLKSSYIFVITANEGGTAGALSQFINEAKKNHIKISYTNSLTTVGNYLPFGAMENNNTISNLQKAEAATKVLVRDITERKEELNGRSPILGGISPGLSKLFTKFSKETATSFLVESHCTMCGSCAKVCPSKNITLLDNVNFSSHCISCYGCTHNCPQNAIRVKNEKSKARYRNKEVTLNEIIEANNQF